MKVLRILKTSLFIVLLFIFYSCNSSKFLEGSTNTKKYTTKEAIAKAQKKYTEVGDFKDGLAAVSKKTRWGFIDRTTTLKIPII